MLRIKKFNSKCYFLCSTCENKGKGQVGIEQVISVHQELLLHSLSCGSSRDSSERVWEPRL